VSEPDDKLTTGAVPVPVKITVCVLPTTPLLLSVKLSEALRFPDADGVNVTLTVQALLGVTVAPVQVSALLAKSLVFVPPTVTVEMMRLAVPALVTVTALAALVVPTGSLAKLTLVVVRLTLGAVPVPLKPTTCGPPLALSAKFREALRLPVADGVNVTLTAQVPLGVTVAPVQVSALLAKSLAFLPPIVAVEMVRLPVPVFVTVTPWAELVVPVG
jgi:hypothetical protein